MGQPAPSFASCCAGLYEMPIVEYLLGESFHPGGRKLTRQLATATLVSPTSDVLDVACGNGNSARTIAADFGATVIGIDYSANNIQRATEAAHASGLEQKTNYICGSAEQLPFAPGSFDVALCECSLCLFENMDNVLDRIYRVLKPGGRIGISDFFLNAPVPPGLQNFLGQVLCVSGALSPDAYRDVLSDAGFEHIRIREVNWTLDDMIARVKNRLKLLATTSSSTKLSIPETWGNPAPVLSELEQFIASGGAGYLLATARKSTTPLSEAAR